MKITSTTYYCDGCGIGPNPSGNVPYLGWLYIRVTPNGIPMAEQVEADLCPACAKRVWATIPQEKSET